MVTTESKVKRMSIREFRASVKADMPLPVIVTADGVDAFAVVRFDILRQALNRPVEIQCPQCDKKVRPESIQGRCPYCREYMNVPNTGAG